MHGVTSVDWNLDVWDAFTLTWEVRSDLKLSPLVECGTVKWQVMVYNFKACSAPQHVEVVAAVYIIQRQLMLPFDVINWTGIENQTNLQFF